MLYHLHAILSDRILEIVRRISCPRRWLVYLPLALTVAGVVALPTGRVRGRPRLPHRRHPTCTKDSTQVDGSDHSGHQPGHRTGRGQAGPDQGSARSPVTCFKAVTAAQDAGCLPAAAVHTRPPRPRRPRRPPPRRRPLPYAAKLARRNTMKTAVRGPRPESPAGTATTPDPAALL